MIESHFMHARPLPVPISVTEITRHRLIRKGAVPILEVTISYPRLEMEGETAGSVLRFNQAYEAMTEAFMDWADGVLAKEASEAYAAMGMTAAYRFDRRLLVCSMQAEPLSPESSALVIHRTVTYSSRRGTVGRNSRYGEDLWRLPSLTLRGGRRDRKLGPNY